MDILKNLNILLREELHSLDAEHRDKFDSWLRDPCYDLGAEFPALRNAEMLQECHWEAKKLVELHKGVVNMKYILKSITRVVEND